MRQGSDKGFLHVLNYLAPLKHVFMHGCNCVRLTPSHFQPSRSDFRADSQEVRQANGETRTVPGASERCIRRRPISTDLSLNRWKKQQDHVTCLR